MTSWWLAALLVVLGVLLALAHMTGRRRPPSSKAPPEAYAKVEALLTPAELRFWAALLEGLPDGVVACPKVRLLDVLEPKRRSDVAARNGVIQKHADFVLIERGSSQVIAVIELDDSTHFRPPRQNRDRFVEAALATAGLPLIRFRVAASFEPGEVCKRLELALGAQPDCLPEEGTRQVRPIRQP